MARVPVAVPGLTQVVLDRFDSMDPIWREPSQFKAAVAPEIAAQILDGTNHENRTISWRKVRDYSLEMRKGNWLYNPADAICMDWDNILRNGQHRLLAVIESDTTQEFAFATCTDPKAQDIMDSGVRRTTAHQLGMSGYEDPKALASIGRISLHWQEGTIISGLRAPSTPDIRKWVEEADEQALKFAVMHARRVSKFFPLQVGHTGAAAYQGYLKDSAAAETFFEALEEGVGLSKNHPILTLRNYLTRHGQLKTRLLPHHQLWLVVSTWNTWRAGRKLGKIMSPSEWSAETFPKMR